MIPAFWKEEGVLYYDIELENSNNTENDGCNPFTYISLHNKKNEYSIIITHRGNCAFVTKARNAQKIGANMLLIINDQPGPVPGTLITNDGTGADITIPSVMISKEDGEKIISYMKLHPDIKIILNIDYLAQATNKASLHYIFSSSDVHSYLLLDNLAYILLQDFKDKIDFIPTYVILRSPFYNKARPIKTENCLSNGLYCYFPESKSKISDGRQIVLENLRQICLYNTIVKEKYKDNDLMLYFTYLNRFYKECINIQYPSINELCSYKIMKELQLETNAIDMCIINSFGVIKKENAMYEKNSTLLANQYNTIQSYGINMFPIVFINEKPLLGAITINKIIGTLCSALIEKPKICDSYGKKTILTQRITRKFIIWIVISFILINFVILLLCRRYLKKRFAERMDNSELEIESKINRIVGTYFALKDIK